MLQISRLNYEFVYLGLELFIYIFYFLKRRINKTTKKGDTKKKYIIAVDLELFKVVGSQRTPSAIKSGFIQL